MWSLLISIIFGQLLRMSDFSYGMLSTIDPVFGLFVLFRLCSSPTWNSLLSSCLLLCVDFIKWQRVMSIWCFAVQVGVLSPQVIVVTNVFNQLLPGTTWSVACVIIINLFNVVKLPSWIGHKSGLSADTRVPSPNWMLVACGILR